VVTLAIVAKTVVTFAIAAKNCGDTCYCSNFHEDNLNVVSSTIKREKRGLLHEHICSATTGNGNLLRSF